MKRKYKKTKKGHARRNATIKRRKHTMRQRGGAPVIDVVLSGHPPIDGRTYNVHIKDTYEDGSPKYEFSGIARATVMHAPCGIHSRCEPHVSYDIVDGVCSYKRYEPDRTYSIYEGQYTGADYKKNGHGKLTYSDGTVYEGNWVNDAMSGYGKLTFPRMKSRLATNMRDNMIYPSIYEGEWNDNRKSGTGTMVYHDGSVYTGQWDNDLVNGNGKMVYYYGDVYEGEFVNEQQHGSGKYTFFNHPVFQEYEGEFDNGEMNGHGRMVMRNGDVYKGEFEDDDMHGEGVMEFHDKTRYKGDWHEGQMHGHGILYDAKENVLFEGKFINNKPHSKRGRILFE